MLVIPAVDLRGGACVRLYQGRFRQEVYRGDPLAAARRWRAAGARRLHVVDLDGARSGRPQNLAVVARLKAELGVEIQLGGGLRRREDLAAARAAGARWLILGTAAARDPAVVAAACREYGDGTLVSLDVREGRVQLAGWEEESVLPVEALARQLAALGVETFIYTDTGRDGTLTGPDLDGACSLAQAAGRPVLVAGGFGHLAEVEAAAAREAEGIAGVILGRALYAGTISLAEAIKIGERSESDAG
ncbi:HisA/HisF-related TIM barrel protein [Gelria sp. Kuro-4]|jgi:phosphoribosylformimino-5-aminoimidazole carboxamide ribotide isomerase|uniref:HisA/HisF-related TIM barrel protein n=1 Tax=Gelria sp. Kuro-4 TaxID=2796927 RepID=UPI001BF013ED|nr:HisA/HisF-related TIM barrel protein [Gelria sp. Kuro-4]BCV25430.1 1-(5-phosphoribosyl)-5-[(5-phosphoribosylamino) methylideneamino] imidazole-4-carboxamide isomerase [Gelria sp. Kuro-4]